MKKFYVILCVVLLSLWTIEFVGALIVGNANSFGEFLFYSLIELQLVFIAKLSFKEMREDD